MTRRLSAQEIAEFKIELLQREYEGEVLRTFLSFTTAEVVGVSVEHLCFEEILLIAPCSLLNRGEVVFSYLYDSQYGDAEEYRQVGMRFFSGYKRSKIAELIETSNLNLTLPIVKGLAERVLGFDPETPSLFFERNALLDLTFSKESGEILYSRSGSLPSTDASMKVIEKVRGFAQLGQAV